MRQEQQENPFDWLGVSDATITQLEPHATMYLGRMSDSECIYDAEFMPLVAQYRWSLHYCGKGKYYARAERCPTTKQKIRLYMHRLICLEAHGPAPSPKHVADHRNGNSLDNRADNLIWRDAWANRWRHGAEHR